MANLFQALSAFLGGNSEEKIPPKAPLGFSEIPAEKTGDSLIDRYNQRLDEELRTENLMDKQKEAEDVFSQKRMGQDKQLALLRDPKDLEAKKAATQSSIPGQFLHGLATALQFTPRGSHIGNAILGKMSHGKAAAENELAVQVQAGNQLEEEMRKQEEQQIKNREEYRKNLDWTFGDIDRSHMRDPNDKTAQVYQYLAQKMDPKLGAIYGTDSSASTIQHNLPDIEKVQGIVNTQEGNRDKSEEAKRYHDMLEAQRRDSLAARSEGREDSRSADERKRAESLSNEVAKSMTLGGNPALKKIKEDNTTLGHTINMALNPDGTIKNMDAREAKLFAEGAVRAVSGSRPQVQMALGLDPATGASKLQTLAEKFTGKPRGLEAQQFWGVLVKDLKQMKSLNDEDYKDELFSNANRLNRIKDTHPDLYENAFSGTGYTPEHHEEWIQNKLKRNDPSGGEIDVILPNGKPGRIPSGKLDSLIKAGGKKR